jgi:hypothetical protein
VRPFFFAFAALVFEEATGGVLLSGVFIVVMLIFLGQVKNGMLFTT